MINKFAKKRGDKGFTLVELLIVIAIIGILASIALPQFSAYRRRGYVTATRSDVKNSHLALLAYLTLNPTSTIPAVSTSGPGNLAPPYEGARVSPDVTITIESDGTVTGIHTDYTGYQFSLDINGYSSETIP